MERLFFFYVATWNWIPNGTGTKWKLPRSRKNKYKDGHCLY